MIFISLSLLLAACSDEFDPLGYQDLDVPFAVTDLAITTRNDSTFLTWTATGDDGPNGTAARYDLRQLETMITTGNWKEARPMDGASPPRSAGSPESYLLSGQGDPSPVYMALKTVDEAGNTSGLSNVVFADIVPPALVADLDTLRVRDTFVVLTWTAPTDDGPLGHPARYEVRWDTAPLTEANWEDQIPISGPIRPLAAGETETHIIHGLDPSTTYHAAIRGRDEAGNLSGLSNGVEFTTVPRAVGWWEGFADLEVDGSVRTLHAMGDTLYLGGHFTSIGGSVGKGIATWDGTEFAGLAGGMLGGVYGTSILNLTEFQGDLYVGGSFGRAGTVPAQNLVRWTGTEWQELGISKTAGHPWSLAVHGNDLWIGWIFNSQSAWPFESLTRFDGNTLHPMNWNTDTSTAPVGMIGYEGKLFLCGGFERFLGKPASGILTWDGQDFAILDEGLSGGYWETPYPTAMCEFQGDLVVGGEFSHADGQLVNHIARYDGNAWHPLGTGLLGDRVHVMDIAVYRDYLVVAGQFESAGGVTANNIALWDGKYWIPMGEGLMIEPGGYGGAECLAVHQGSLYVGGSFISAGGVSSPSIARWDLD
jgi:hypothetical protein